MSGRLHLLWTSCNVICSRTLVDCAWSATALRLISARHVHQFFLHPSGVFPLQNCFCDAITPSDWWFQCEVGTPDWPDSVRIFMTALEPERIEIIIHKLWPTCHCQKLIYRCCPVFSPAEGACFYFVVLFCCVTEGYWSTVVNCAALHVAGGLLYRLPRVVVQCSVWLAVFRRSAETDHTSVWWHPLCIANTVHGSATVYSERGVGYM